VSVVEGTVRLMRPRRYTDEQLVDAACTCNSMRDVIAALGLVPRGGNYETVRRRMAVLGLQISEVRKLTRGKRLSSCSREEVAEALRNSRSLAQVLAKLGVRPGGNQARVRDLIQQMGLDTTHLAGKGWRRGTTDPAVRARPIEQLLVDGRYAETNRLKKRLILEGFKQSRCEMCVRDSWNGHAIPLELDHINGRRDDNRLANLRILCPNCHAQTDTYRGKNRGAWAHV
jgi:hypothetical protein